MHLELSTGIHDCAISLSQKNAKGAQVRNLGISGISGTDGTFSAILSGLARPARFVAVNVAHQVTPRGNARQFILAADSKRLVYLQLLEQYVVLHGLSLLAY